MAEVKQVMLCGFGGQDIVLGGTLLGYAAFNDDAEGLSPALLAGKIVTEELSSGRS